MKIEEIKIIRKKLSLTQSELAKESGVSQSLIAKIESGNLDPTYSNAQKIFESLNTISQKNELNSGDIIQNKILSIKPDSDISTAIKLMERHNISQLPVIEDNKSIGMVSETIILEALINKKTGTVKEIMRDSPPIVSSKTNVHAISSLLKFFPMVLVSKNGKLKGVITKSDLLEKLY